MDMNVAVFRVKDAEDWARWRKQIFSVATMKGKAECKKKNIFTLKTKFA